MNEEQEPTDSTLNADLRDPELKAKSLDYVDIIDEMIDCPYVRYWLQKRIELAYEVDALNKKLHFAIFDHVHGTTDEKEWSLNDRGKWVPRLNEGGFEIEE
jgi:hypothetical protein